MLSLVNSGSKANIRQMKIVVFVSYLGCFMRIIPDKSKQKFEMQSKKENF